MKFLNIDIVWYWVLNSPKYLTLYPAFDGLFGRIGAGV